MLTQLEQNLPIHVRLQGGVAEQLAQLAEEHNRLITAVGQAFELLNRDGALHITDAAIDATNGKLSLPFGAFTPGISFGGASVGLTTSLASGIYVNVAGAILATGIVRLSAKGASTGSARLKGLPFTIYNDLTGYSAAALHVNDITFTGMVQGYTEIGTTTIALTEATAAGGAYAALNDTDFTNTSEILFTVFYRAA